MILNSILGGLAALSLALLLWQWLAARRFPLHQRGAGLAFTPGVTLFKPLKGCDNETEACLRSWLAQRYGGPVQILFGVAAADDPVCGLVRNFIQQYPKADAHLVICGPPAGANAKVSTLARLEPLAKHDVVVISDADVRVPADFLANVVAPLQAPDICLVNCFYRLAHPTTLAMQWEAIAINADFWSQVLQSNSLKPMDFALGAVMAVRRAQLAEIGGFKGLVDCLADDYLLGNRIARRGYRLELSPVVVECCSEPMDWAAVWKHQLRWGRTIRVCQPVPYFFSILSNPTLWPLLWLAVCPGPRALAVVGGAWLLRVSIARNLQKRLRPPVSYGYHPSDPPGGRAPLIWLWLVPLKDLLQAALWLMAYLGNHVEWRGQRLRLRRDGTLVKS